MVRASEMLHITGRPCCSGVKHSMRGLSSQNEGPKPGILMRRTAIALLWGMTCSMGVQGNLPRMLVDPNSTLEAAEAARSYDLHDDVRFYIFVTAGLPDELGVGARLWMGISHEGPTDTTAPTNCIGALQGPSWDAIGTCLFHFENVCS